MKWSLSNGEHLPLTENTTCSIKLFNTVGIFIGRDEQFYKKSSMRTPSEIQFAVRFCGLSGAIVPPSHTGFICKKCITAKDKVPQLDISFSLPFIIKFFSVGSLLPRLTVQASGCLYQLHFLRHNLSSAISPNLQKWNIHPPIPAKWQTALRNY